MKRRIQTTAQNEWTWFLILAACVWLIVLSLGAYASWKNEARKKECESIARATFVPNAYTGKCVKEISIE